MGIRSLRRVNAQGGEVLALALAMVVCLYAGESSAGLVVPNDLASSPGDLQNSAPFSGGDPNSSDPLTLRYQQVYGAPDLSSWIGREISGIAFRLNEPPGPSGDVVGGFVYDDIEIRLSTTARSVDGLSTNLDTNVGPDVVLVYDGVYVLPNLEGDQPVNPFDMVFTLATPFTYTGGNLLMDVRMPDCDPPGFYMDAAWRGGNQTDAVSRAYALVGGYVGEDTLGLVTEFIPDPTTFAVLVVGGLTLLRRRRKAN